MGKARVVGINPLNQAVSLELESKAVVEMPVSKITWQKKTPETKPQDIKPEEDIPEETSQQEET